MGRTVHASKRFEKDVALAKKRGKDTAGLRAAIELPVAGQPLPRELNDHPLKGNWKGCRDLPIEPDGVLIYKADDTHLWLVRTGTHADVFG
jgi:mRNA interferase YafQ